jgi:16S rRNA (cytidine1402-2'-O)-methyltransferase
MGNLYLVATPIGNLEDITYRAVRILGEVELIAAEDTRHSSKLLDRYGIKTPRVSYFEHNKIARLDRILAALAAGDVALISDAGTPGLSDPGYELVLAALDAGHRVIPVPGPSAILAALAASGQPTDRFSFFGYLPRKEGARRAALKEMAGRKETVVFFETPHRLAETLQDMKEILGEGTPLSVCREMTKQYEEFLRGTIGTAEAHFRAVEPRGEFTLILNPQRGAEVWDEGMVRAALTNRINAGQTPSQAAREVANDAGWRRADVYRLTLEDE